MTVHMCTCLMKMIQYKNKNMEIVQQFINLILFKGDIGVFPKRNRNSPNLANSWNLQDRRSMKWGSLCLSGTKVGCWFLAQEIVGSNTIFVIIFFYNFLRFYRILWNFIRKITLDSSRVTAGILKG